MTDWNFYEIELSNLLLVDNRYHFGMGLMYGTSLHLSPTLKRDRLSGLLRKMYKSISDGLVAILHFYKIYIFRFLF